MTCLEVESVFFFTVHCPRLKNTTPKKHPENVTPGFPFRTSKVRETFSGGQTTKKRPLCNTNIWRGCQKTMFLHSDTLRKKRVLDLYLERDPWKILYAIVSSIVYNHSNSIQDEPFITKHRSSVPFNKLS